MKLRTQLASAITLVAIGPLLLQGVLNYGSHRRDLSRTVLNHLESVASIQQSRLSAILQQNAERLALTSSRTQLRINLDRLQSTGDPRAVASMNRILRDAAASIPDIVGITVYDRRGMAVAATDEDAVGRPHFDPAFFDRCRETTVVDRLYRDDDGALGLYLSGPMEIDGRFLGVMVIRAGVENLLASIGDYAGLGRTGETILARLDQTGHYVFLAPTRFVPSAPLAQFRQVAAREGSGRELFAPGRGETWRDYRGIQVLAATRDVPGTDWFLAVKIDRREAFHELNRTATLMLALALVFSVLVITFALRFAHRWSRPLSELAAAASDVAAGDYGRRVRVRSTDEIGVLERSFNTMSAEVAETRERLEGKIMELNLALADIKTLAGIIPICAGCKKIRDDQGYWNQLESYLADHSEARFSHGLCPECLAKYAADLDEE